jgi:hypothetical protein
VDPLAVNAPLLSEILTRREVSSQADLPLASEGVLRYVWESKFGPMLIEVKDGRAFVNGQPVAPAEERFVQTSLREWAYAQPSVSSAQREAALQPFLHRYNWHRPHSALNHQPPMTRIPAVSNLLELNI